MAQRQESVGRKRLRILLGICGFVACAIAMALVVALYGAPYNPIWWWVMAAVLAGTTAMAALMASAVEWVLDGYRRDSGA